MHGKQRQQKAKKGRGGYGREGEGEGAKGCCLFQVIRLPGTGKQKARRQERRPFSPLIQSPSQLSKRQAGRQTGGQAFRDGEGWQ